MGTNVSRLCLTWFIKIMKHGDVLKVLLGLRLGSEENHRNKVSITGTYLVGIDIPDTLQMMTRAQFKQLKT